MFLDYQAAVTLALLAMLLSTLYNLRRIPRLSESDPIPEGAPLVSVLVPARNEARNIAACIRSLVAQDYPNLEIWVLDDASTDGTGDIVREIAAQHAQVRLVKGLPLPEGWHGKTWACQQLSQVAGGEWLLFTDADTRHAPHSVSASMACIIREQADLLSLVPHMVVNSFWERVIMSIIPFALLGVIPLPLLTRTRSPFLACAIGTFMLFRRATYERLGGHESVRSDITEDVFLARQVKRAGGRIAMADGTATLSVRFYQGIGETWRGLCKSVFAALNYSPLVAAVAVAGCFAVFVFPCLFLYQAVQAGLSDLGHFSLPLTQVIVAAVGRWFIDGRFHIPRRFSLLHPLTILLVGFLMVHSALLSLVGPGTEWKGRVYQYRRGG